MILNGYTVLAAFLCFVRVVLAVVVVIANVSALSSRPRRNMNEELENSEKRTYLSSLTTAILIALNVISWPVLYLILQSHVRLWPAVMCIYGVTRIGQGSIGASRFLPKLLSVLFWSKPILVFLSGAALLLYLLNRRTRTSMLRRRLLIILLLTGAVTLMDGVVEGTWLLIPKEEVHLAAGCCTTTAVSLGQRAKFTPDVIVDEEHRVPLIATYYSLNGILIGLLLGVTLRTRTKRFVIWAWLIAGIAALVLPVGLLFLNEVVAPVLLGLPHHHCAYDLISVAPDSVLSVPLLLLGTFSAGWAVVTVTIGQCDETLPILRNYLVRIWFMGLIGLCGSVVLLSAEMLLS